MGERGPARKPTALRALEGGKSRNPNEPKPPIDVDVPKCPKHLRGAARREWNLRAPDLHRVGLLTVADLELFERWCVAVQIGREAYAEWAKPVIGYVWRGPDMVLGEDGRPVEIVLAPAFSATVQTYRGAPVKHPSLQPMRDSTQTMLDVSRRFGFTPGDRASITVPKVPDAKAREMATPRRVRDRDPSSG